MAGEHARRIDELDEPGIGMEDIDENVETGKFISGERRRTTIVENFPETQRSASSDAHREVLPSVAGTVPTEDTMEEIWERNPVTGQETTGFVARGTMPVKSHPGAPFEASVDSPNEEDDENRAPPTQRNVA
jgi:hypothetical protein